MSRAVPARTPSRGLPSWTWAVGAPLVVAVAALIPLAFNPRFYFYADTQDGAYGIWYDIGRSILNGEWPLFSVDGWMAGNHVAEGQWGLWNPLILAIGVFVYLTPNAVIGSSIIKIVFLAFAAGGAYLMARSYGASRPLSFTAGVAAPLGGFTLFMDASSWVTNLFVWAFFPWVLVALRGMLWRRWNPAAALVLGYLLVTIGYVHGTILLVLLYVALGIETLIRRRWRSFWTLFAVGVIHGLVAITVYLPGVLTAPVSARETETINNGFMVATFTGLATSAVPSSRTELLGWWGQFTDTPLMYIAWFLPLFAFVDYRRARRTFVPSLSLYLVLIFSVAFVVGPSNVGALQFPVRIMPWVALATIVILAVLLSRALAIPLTRARLFTALALVAAGWWLAYSQVPSWWKVHAAGVALQAVGVVVVWLLMRHSRFSSDRDVADVRASRRRFASVVGAPSAAAAIVVISLLVLVLQARIAAPILTSAVPAPDEDAEYALALEEAKGDAFVVGSASSFGTDILDETLLSNSWYLSSTPTHNLYSPVQYRTYAEDLCLSHTGTSCSEAVDRLFAIDRSTGERRVDLLSIDTVQLIRDADETVQDLLQIPVPEGWSVADSGDDTVTWTRDGDVAPAGEVVWESDGTSTTLIENSDMSVSFRVDSVGPVGGEVVLSRLAWPGYLVQNAVLGEPLRDYLLTVDVDEAAEGEVVTVSFVPPSWHLGIACMLAALLGAVLISVAAWRRNRRLSRTR